MLNIFIIFLICLIHVSSILKSENVKLKYITLPENNLPESRILIDRQKKKIEDKVKEKKKNKNENELEKVNKKELKSNEKPVLINKHNFKVNFMKEKEKPSAKEIKIFYDNLIKLNKKGSITIKGYAKKREGDSTSKVRRLSLKRALFLRSLLLKENYNITQIYVKALGHDNELEGNKDIVIITNN